MIGVKPKKKKITNPPDAPDINLEVGQAAIYGKVTAKNPDGSQSPVQDVEVAIFQNENLIVFAITSEEGLYQTSAINAGDKYTMEFTKESTILIPEFSLASKEIKQVNVEFSNDNI